MNDNSTKVADATVVFSWVAWYFSHQQEVNSALQTLLLLVSIIGAIAACLYHFRKWRQMGKGRRR